MSKSAFQTYVERHPFDPKDIPEFKRQWNRMYNANSGWNYTVLMLWLLSHLPGMIQYLESVDTQPIV